MHPSLHALIEHTGPADPPWPRGEPTNEECKKAVHRFEALVGDSRLFRSYYRNVERNCQPEGVAVAFFIGAQLFVGASQCHLPRTRKQAGQLPQAAHDMLRAIDATLVAFNALHGTTYYLEQEEVSYDKWERYVGQWLAIEAARPLDTAIATAVEAYAAEHIKPAYEGWYERCANISGLSVAQIKELPKKPRMPRDEMQHLLCGIAGTTSRYLPDVAEWPEFQRWLQFSQGGANIVPPRLRAACVGVISNAIHCKRTRAVQAKLPTNDEKKLAPVGVGV